jgi:phosphocarrier protein
MPEITLTINNKVGLHARPASLFVKEAAKFKSNINVAYGERNVNAKSILNVLTLGINQGAVIKVEAVGEDAAEALEAINNLAANNFGETE